MVLLTFWACTWQSSLPSASSAGALVFGEHAPLSTWLGLARIVSGGAVIQFGPR